VNNVRTKANKFLWSVDHHLTRRLARNFGTLVHQKNVMNPAAALPLKHANTPDFIGLFRSLARAEAVNIGGFRDQIFKPSNFGPNLHRFVSAKVPRKRAVNKTEKIRFSYASICSKNLGNSATIIAVFGQH
jgi:hypothetical protein